MSWFQLLQAISSTAEWEKRADLRNMLLGIQEGAVIGELFAEVF